MLLVARVDSDITVIPIIVFIFRGYIAYSLHRKHHFSNFCYDHFWWHDDRSDCCHDWDSKNHLYCYRYCPFVTTTSCGHTMTHDDVIMFAIAGLIDISIIFAMIVFFFFFPHRYSFVVGIVLINTVSTDMEAIDVSSIIVSVPSVNTFVEANASLTIVMLRSKETLQYERVYNDFNFPWWRSSSISVSTVSWSFRLSLVLTS